METVETPQPMQPAEPKLANWPKIILATILGFGLLATAAYTGYWYGSKLPSETQPLTNPSPTTLPTPTTTPMPTPDPTAGWETYTDTKLGFSLSVPPECEASPIEESSGGPDDFLRGVQVAYRSESVDERRTTLIDGYAVTIKTGDFVAPERGGIKLNNITDVANHYYPGDKSFCDKDNCEITPISSTTVSGDPALTYSVEGPLPYDATITYRNHYYFVFDGIKVFMIRIRAESTDDVSLLKYQREGELILSSLKFL